MLVGALAFVVVLVGYGAVGLDWMSRNLEMDRLVTAIELSESAMERTQQDVLQVTAGTDPSAKLSDAELTAMAEELRWIALDGQRRIHDAGLGVAGVGVLPWHRDVQEAQDAYLAHNQAWQDYLGVASNDARELFREQPDVNATFSAAEPLLKRAVPDPSAFRLTARVSRIFTDGQGDSAAASPTV